MKVRHSGRRFEPFAKGSGSVQVQAECSRTFFKRFSREQVRFFGNAQSIVKCGRCNLPPASGNLHRLFHSSMPEFSGTPIHRKTREVQFAAGGRQIAQTFPLIDARFFSLSPIVPISEHHKKVRRSTKGSVQVQVQPTPPFAMRSYKNNEMQMNLMRFTELLLVNLGKSSFL